MALLFIILCLIILSPIGFIWLNYVELNSCKDNSYEHLVRINKAIEAIEDIAPSFMSVLVGSNLVNSAKNLEVRMAIESLVKLQNNFKNAKTRYEHAKRVFDKIETEVVAIKDRPEVVSSEQITRYINFFERIRGDFTTYVDKYNVEIRKFKIYTEQFPTSYIAEKLEIYCIMESFE